MVKLIAILLLFFCTNLFAQEKLQKGYGKKISISKLIQDSLNLEKINGIDCFSGIYFSQIIFNDANKKIEVIDSIPERLRIELELLLNQNQAMLNMKLLKNKGNKILQPFMIHLTEMCNIPESIVSSSDTSISPVIMYRQMSIIQANTINQLKKSFNRKQKTWNVSEKVILLEPCLIEYKSKAKKRDNIVLKLE
jgi:hypothetical protein